MRVLLQMEEFHMGKSLNGKELGKGIYQRKNGKYCARFVNRFGQRTSVYGDTLKEVKNKLAEATTNDIRKQNIVNVNTTLDDWFDMWMDVYKTPVIRLSTKRIYDDVYNTKISPVLGGHKISEITKIQVTSLVNDLGRQGYEWGTLNRVRVLLIDMFDRAMEDDFVTKNPARGVRLPKNKPANDPKALTREEQDLFFECSAGTFYHNLFVVAVNTGLRPGELFALTENDIDFNKKEIRVTKTLLYQKLDGDEKKEFHIDPPKTNTSNRAVPMNQICENALVKQIMQHKVIQNNCKSQKDRQLQFPDLIFTTKFGTPLNSVLYSEAISRIIAEINLTRDALDQIDDFGGHTFRHTFATRCFEAGIPVKTVQSYLGHANISMTMDLYTSVLKDKSKNDMELLEKSIGIKAPDTSGLSKSKIVRMYG